MIHLTPKLATLQKEYVLVQAFKKTVNYIRGHNWFADVLELDLATVDYPTFLKALQTSLSRSARWKSKRLRLVPAPKSAPWLIDADSKWQPTPTKNAEPPVAQLRPLAHVPLRDQVVATALMMCIADQIETIQGDPRLDIRDAASRRRVISYGNRLFCDSTKLRGETRLHHRWGAAKLYRSYYEDYRTFVSRPEVVAGQIGERSKTRAVVVHSDLSKFYDRVRPTLLHKKLKSRLGDIDTMFWNLAKHVLQWEWADEDRDTAIELSGVEGFESIALPQGLVAAGFFANVVLLDFDDALRDAFGSRIAKGIKLHDAARYVDDLRLVIEADESLELPEIEGICHRWLEEQLKDNAPGLTANGDKTRAVAVHDSQRVMVFQSSRMRRIQETVSGGFDAHGGTQLLAALEGLFNTIGQFIETDENGTRWPLRAVPDVRDDTVARFVAGRYRSTYRSLRPLLEDEISPFDRRQSDDDEALDAVSAILTKDELDRQSQAFALRLIEQWIRNPGNVRLLRVGLDLFPDATILESVLNLLRPAIESSQADTSIRAVVEYCLSEIFRAAATETGLVQSDELLPDGTDIDQYQDVLRDFAIVLLNEHWESLAWFCRQQILLFLATTSPVGVDLTKANETVDIEDYGSLIGFLQGQAENDSHRWAIHAVLARKSFLDATAAANLIVPQLTKERLSALADLCPSLAEELLLKHRRLFRHADERILAQISLPPRPSSARANDSFVPLIVEARKWDCLLRNELSLIEFAQKWLANREDSDHSAPPAAIQVQCKEPDQVAVKFTDNIRNPLFEAPSWCSRSERWRFELGLVLRFIVTGQSDPTESLHNPSWREHEKCYRPPTWHWRVRRYSIFNARQRLGPEWLPLSSWMESFLTSLLSWPGAQLPPKPFRQLRTVAKAQDLCRERRQTLEELRGESTRLLMLPVTPRSARLIDKARKLPLRVCIAQVAVPEFLNGHAAHSFGPHDPECGASATRHAFRRHLTAMLAGIDQMLRVRNTHKPDSGLDLLVLPELAVHPDDVRTRLLPFVRKHRCWVFAGQTYHRCHASGPLVNSGLWIVPECSPTHGVSYRCYEQGKQHLAPEELASYAGIVQGHRPCQWLMNWQWSTNATERPLVVTGSICYDATDIALAADLKRRSDIYLISALNRDVGTFDRMTEALHYHMYQMIVLANHAHFGGSNAYLPYREQFQKQVFHLHGKDEAVVAFFDIDDPADLVSRGSAVSKTRTTKLWKTPPANWK